MKSCRTPMRHLVSILFALLAATGQAHAQLEPTGEGREAVGWILPEEVPARADALRRKLEAAEPTEAAQSSLEEIESDLEQLGPDLDILLDSATATLARRASILQVDELRSQLTDASAPLGAWAEALDAEATRVGKALADITHEQRLWSETRSRPETAEADARVGRSVQRSIEALDTAIASLRAWRARVLTPSNRLSDRRAADDAMIERLQAALVYQRANLFVPQAPLWQSGFGTELRSELPHVPEELLSYASGTRAYVESNPRPLVEQVLLAALLMFGFRRLSLRARERLGEQEGSSRMVRRLERPYAVGLLLAFLATPLLHPLAPRRFVQVVAMVALFPTARIVIHATERANLTAFAGLFVLTLLGQLTLALAPLPAVASASVLLFLTVALGLAFWFTRRIDRTRDGAWLRRALNVAMLAFALAFLAALAGWSDAATLVGRAIVASAIAALFIYAAVVALNPLLVYLLTSPTLRRSHLLDRRTAVLQRQVERGLRWLGALFWLYLALRGAGLLNAVVEALRAVLQGGISVGALSLSIGGVLAFVLSLLGAVLLARIVTGVLEEDVYPRTSLPRGMSYALSSLVRYGVYSLGFLIALAAAGVQFSQLTILLGGFGIGIGLGLQDLVKNFAAGLTLLVERRLALGDALQIPSQHIFGRVLSIGLRATVVRSWDGSEVVVPNADLVSGAVTNWTLSDRLCRIEVPVGVAYGTDPDRVVALLLDAARSNDQLLADPAPQALFKGFGESSLDFLLRAWIGDYEQRVVLASELALAVHRGLREAGITIPFPQRDLHLASVSPAVRAAWSDLDRKE